MLVFVLDTMRIMAKGRQWPQLFRLADHKSDSKRGTDGPDRTDTSVLCLVQHLFKELRQVGLLVLSDEPSVLILGWLKAGVQGVYREQAFLNRKTKLESLATNWKCFLFLGQEKFDKHVQQICVCLTCQKLFCLVRGRRIISTSWIAEISGVKSPMLTLSR